MISSAAMAAIKAEIALRGFNEGVLGMAYLLYTKNFADTKATNPSYTDKQVEDICVLHTSIQSVVETANRNFSSQARDQFALLQRRQAAKSGTYDVAIGVLSNVIFVVISLMFYAAFKDTAHSVGQALGFIQ